MIKPFGSTRQQGGEDDGVKGDPEAGKDELYRPNYDPGERDVDGCGHPVTEIGEDPGVADDIGDPGQDYGGKDGVQRGQALPEAEDGQKNERRESKLEG